MINASLGSTVKDVVTGIQGIAIAECKYLSGCTQILVQPQGVKSDGAAFESSWIDVQRLINTNEPLIELDNYLVPGNDKLPPKR